MRRAGAAMAGGLSFHAITTAEESPEYDLLSLSYRRRTAEAIPVKRRQGGILLAIPSLPLNRLRPLLHRLLVCKAKLELATFSTLLARASF